MKWWDLMLINGLCGGGVALLVIGALSIIRLDGSIKRVILSAAAILIGVCCLTASNYLRSKIPNEYTIFEVKELTTNCRIVLKGGGETRVFYTSKENMENFTEGQTIELTDLQIKEYSE